MNFSTERREQEKTRMRTSKEINRYTDLLTAEIISTMSEYVSFDHVTDINNEKMQDRIQKVLIRETMDIQEVN